ncbi:multidrug effflux MFS transporter [Vineibacter terrae]|uniref:multidrug effflux MFS transporter n=1 Tax=Vineibacter terrae TaxID=2586908 RepID=UPI002E3077FB|nr:multidrug effflux MFS transporter [Vineibacter terrae]HEX2887367.1 multidrug effflux MFS transporter [Vineibacter terrae]
MQIAPRSVGYVVLLVALSSFGPLTMSIYTPVMPLIGGALGASPDAVKLTLTSYMLGFAIGQLFYGPLSDRFGRRPVLLGGLLFFVATTIGCIYAHSIANLIAQRFFQGVGACAGVVIGRALARDVYEYRDMPRVMGWISLALNIAPAIAPSVGGYLGERFGWSATFWVLAVFSSVLFVVTAVGLPETNKHRSAAIDLVSLLRGSGDMLRDRLFLGYVLTMGFSFAINFGMIAGTPFILQDSLGFTPREFGLLVLISVSGFTAGGICNQMLIGRVAPPHILQGATTCHLLALTVMAVPAYFNTLAWWSIVVPHALLSFGSGMVVPTASAGAIGLHPKLAGTASSLFGLAQMGIGAIGTVVVAVLTGWAGHSAGIPMVGEWAGCRTVACGVPMPLVIGLAPFAISGALSAWMLRRVSRREAAGL